MSPTRHMLQRRAMLVGGLLAWPLAVRARFADPLDTAAPVRSAPGSRPLLGLAGNAGQLIGVGSRGLIVRSTNRGKDWVQSPVPVQSDLVAALFTNESLGWAVGHDGVVLHSADAGRTWSRQLDGRSAATAFDAFYAAQGGAGETYRAQVSKNLGNGPAIPYLDLWFQDERRGFVVGSFGQIAATSDGGKTWEPWLHNIDNPEHLNLNAVRGVAGKVWIAGERGTVFRLDSAAGRFQTERTEAAGSFFGISGHEDVVLAYGLRGTVQRRAGTRESGAWSAVAMPPAQSIVSGAYHPEAGFVLLDITGQLLLGSHDGLRWTARPPARPMRAAGLLMLDRDTVVVATLDGAQVVSSVSSAVRT